MELAHRAQTPISIVVFVVHVGLHDGYVFHRHT